MWLSKQMGIILLLAQLRELSVHIKIIMSTSYRLYMLIKPFIIIVTVQYTVYCDTL